MSMHRGLESSLEAKLTQTAADAVIRIVSNAVGDYQHYADCAEWADKRRILASSSRYTRWSTARTPYLKGIARALASTDPKEKVVVFGKAAQMGGSEIALNEVLRRIDTAQASGILLYMENADKADDWADERLKPALRSRVFSGRAVSHSGNRCNFPGGFLVYNGIGSSASLASTTAQLVIGDEIARYPVSIGGEGDFLSLARQRAITFGSTAKIFLVSTFLDSARGEGSFVDAWESGGKNEYMCPCPECGVHWLWALEHCSVSEEEGAYMICPECGAKTHDGPEREKAVAKGDWVMTSTKAAHDVVSYRISGWIAPPDWRPWSEMMFEYDRALQGKTSLQTFYNTVLGLPYDEPEARVPGAEQTREAMTQVRYKKGRVPKEAAVLTMGFDVQKDHMPWEIKGWSEDLESWSVDRGIVATDLSNPAAAAAAVKKAMSREFKTPDGRLLKVWLAVVDESYKTSGVHQLADYFKEPIIASDVVRVPRQALALYRGASTIVNAKLLLSAPGSKLKSNTRRRQRYWKIGTDVAKRELYTAIARQRASGGRQAACHAPLEYPIDYYQELTAEQIVSKCDKMTGRMVRAFYLAPRVRNEALDLHVMNRVAAEVLGVGDWSPDKWARVRAESRIKASPETREQRREAALEARRRARERRNAR